MKQAVPKISLRTLIMLLVGILVALALLFAGDHLRRSWASYRSAALLSERNEMADYCVQAIKGIASERGRNYLLLRSQRPIYPGNWSFIHQQRAYSEKYLAEIMRHLPENLRFRKEALQLAWDTVKTLRLTVDRELLRPANERQADIAEQWKSASNDLMLLLNNLLADVSDLPDSLGARSELLVFMRIQASQLRDLVGTEANALFAELAAKRIPDRQLIESLNSLHGRTLQIWAQLLEANQRLPNAGLSVALENVHLRWLEGLRPLQEKILDDAWNKRLSEVDLDYYLVMLAPTLDAIIELTDGINHMVITVTQEHLKSSQKQGLLTLGSILVIIAVVGLVILVLVRRFTRPLKAIMHRVDALTERYADAQATNLPAFLGDDFNRVDQALELLDSAVEARLRSEAALNESERISASILANVSQAVIATDLAGRITLFSRGAENMLGYSAAEIVGKQTPSLFHEREEILARAHEFSIPAERVLAPDCNLVRIFSEYIAFPDEREWTYLRKDGKRLTVFLLLTYLHNANGEVNGFLKVASDITERTKIAAEMARLAHHDALTQLPNRRLFDDRMQFALNRARRERMRLALMLIDLDKFKEVNDLQGHTVGDLLLKAVAERMQQCLRETDTLARIGGDEFVVLLEGDSAPQDALKVAEKIRLLLNEPFELGEKITASIGCSIGLSIYPDHGTDQTSLQEHADEAMYRAKASGRNCVVLYEPLGDQDQSAPSASAS